MKPARVATGRSIRGRGLLGLLLTAAVATGCVATACRPAEEAPPPPVPSTPPEPAPAEEPAAAEEPRRGLWVLAEGAVQVLNDPARIPVLLQQARALGASDLFVQVYRGGRAWYDASLADPAPYRENLERHGVDTLALLLEQAHAAGFRVHAWVNVLSLSRNAKAPIVSDLGRDVVLSDRQGRSLLDYPGYDVPQPDRRYYRMGTPGVYLDAAAPGVDARLTATFAELLSRYPALDGLHLDYIRYPDVLPFAPGTRFGVGLDFGYGASTRARFLEETGKQAPIGDSLRNANAWDRWRRDRLSSLVADIASEARRVRPGVVLSAAVWTYADRGYLVLGQDWRRWLEDGSLDVAIPMSYTVDDRLLRYQAEHFSGLPVGDRIWMGLGSWLFAKNPARAVRQVEILDTAGVRNRVLFSYDSIVTEPALFEALRVEAPGGE
ncbi:MAG: family 10 glycosylhydrolase [Myxococcota bacterium]